MKRAIILAAGFLASGAMAGEITVSDAYARASGMNAKVGASFMVVDNASDEAVTLITAAADISAKNEIHTHMMNEDGVMQMREVEGGIEIPAQQCVLLARGGFHIMHMGLNAPLEDGNNFELLLGFDNGEEVMIDVAIDNARGEDEIAPLPEGREECIDAKMHQMKM